VDDGSGDVVISDPRLLRALAHPARITVLHHLFAGEILTATEFAQIAGLTPSAMSYHLRALEKWGLVERVSPAGDGRERPWRSVGRSIRLSPSQSPAVLTARGQVLGSLADLLRSDLSAALSQGAPRRDGHPGDQPAAALPDAEDLDTPGSGEAPAGGPMGFTVLPLTLTDEEAREIIARLTELLKPRATSGTPGTGRRYHAYWALLPLQSGEPATDAR
jgi:DNA-binding transcriptional ArsR family regulator